MRKSRSVYIASATLFAAHVALGADIGTAFTYQGFLEKPAGTPVNDTCDLRFQLWDDAIAGSQRGTPELVNAVNIDNGSFTALIDFGPDAVNGTARWLRIGVRCPGDLLPVFLDPRVELTPVPHALALPGLYTQQNATSPNLIGGHPDNSISTGIVGATIGGGGASGSPNVITAPYAIIGGGRGNFASGDFSFVGGGESNVAQATYATVGGGGIVDTTRYGCFPFQESCARCVGGPNNAAFCSNNSNCPDGACQPNDAECPGSDCFNFAVWLCTGGADHGNACGICTSGGGTTCATALTCVGARCEPNPTACASPGTCASGTGNSVTGTAGTIAGGAGNLASGEYSTVPGGYGNSASGNFSFAAGRGASASHAGTFVWSDSPFGFGSSANNQFLIRASGGVGINTNAPDATLHVIGNARFDQTAGGAVRITRPGGTPGFIFEAENGNRRDIRAYDDSLRLLASNSAGAPNDTNGITITEIGHVAIHRVDALHPLHVGTTTFSGNGAHLTAGGVWTNGSDKNSKENFGPLDSHAILDKVAELPVTQWNYLGEKGGVHHIGPTAQDFRAAFGLGHDDRYITTIDADGVALAAIQGLHELVSEADCRILELDKRTDDLVQHNDQLIRLNHDLSRRNAELEARLARLEALLETREHFNVASPRPRDQGGSVVPESRDSATKAVGDGAIFDGTQKGEKP